MVKVRVLVRFGVLAVEVKFSVKDRVGGIGESETVSG